MFDSVALNVVIGLIFIYLLYSLLVTTINEAIASIFNLRAKKLEDGIKRMLDDGAMSYPTVWLYFGGNISKIILGLKNFLLLFSFKKKTKSKDQMSMVELFYEQPGIKYLGENKISNKPAYISPEFFSKAVMDILKEKAGNPNDPTIKQIQNGITAINDTNETKRFIQSLLTDANNDLDKFKTLLEQWFNETMERTSGWYKKQSQRITLLLGFVVAVSFNVDTIAIVKNLSNNPKAAEKMADAATVYTETHKDEEGLLTIKEKETVAALFKEVKELTDNDIKNAKGIIGLGWDIPSHTTEWTPAKNPANINRDLTDCKECIQKLADCTLFGYNFYLKGESSEINRLGKVRYVVCMALSSGKSILGWILTAFAISLGAPFWFDLLNKLIQLRVSKKPDEPTGKTSNK